MTPLDISTAPKDGTRILLQYHTRHFKSYGQPHQVTGTKWEECRFFDDKAITGSAPHWEPWTGNDRIRTTNHINPADVLAWLPLPI